MPKGFITHQGINYPLNWHPQPVDFRDHVLLMEYLPITATPADGPFGNEQYLGPVLDQGAEGSCTANGGAGLFSFTQKAEGIDIIPISRAKLYYDSRVMDGSPTSQDTGSYARTVCKVLNTLGDCPESDMPYVAGRWMDIPPAKAIADSQFKLTQYLTFTPSQNFIASLFASKRGFISGFSVYSSFESAQVAATGIIPMPQAGDKLLGGHLTEFYDCDPTYVYGQNSWGPGWGITGKFKMPWAYVLSTLMSDFQTFSVVADPIPQPTPTPTPIPTVDYATYMKLGFVSGKEWYMAVVPPPSA